MEKRLAALLEESAENKRKFKERKYAIRYHRIRFFERVKLERNISKLKRALENEHDAEKTEGLRSMLAQAEDDLEYVLHFPKGEKYVSILKNSQDPEAQTALEAERKRLRILVKKHLEDEAIVNEMDEGKSRASVPATRDSALAIKGPTAGGAEDSVEPIVHKQDDMADDDFFLTESRSSSSESEVDEISKDSQIISSSSQDEQPIDNKATVERAMIASKHNDTIQESKEPRKSQVDVVTKRKSHKVERAKGKMDSLRQHTRKPPDNREAKINAKTRKRVDKRDRTDSKQVSKSKTVASQPLRTRAEGGRKRRRKAQSK